MEGEGDGGKRNGRGGGGKGLIYSTELKIPSL